MENNKEQLSVDVEINDETAEGKYSNLAIINHSPTEFVVDFISIMPAVPKAKVRSRIILSPQHAKRLMGALSENIKRYEMVYGQIQDFDIPPIHNFGPKGEA